MIQPATGHRTEARQELTKPVQMAIIQEVPGQNVNYQEYLPVQVLTMHYIDITFLLFIYIQLLPKSVFFYYRKL